MKLSIIIPAHNEEDNVREIFEKIEDIFQNINFEVIFVDDGSTDNTFTEMKNIYKEHPRHIRVINFSRNFGKDAAIYAGLEHSIGEYTAIIDADLQQNPTYLVDMLNFLEANPDYDQVAMTVKKRKTGLIKRIGSKLFYNLINILSDIRFPKDASDFRMFNQSVKKAILKIKKKNRFSKGLFSWIGFNTKLMSYEVESRKKGNSKFGLISSTKYAINGLVGFSTRPLKLATIFGVISSIIGFSYLLYVMIKTIILGADTPGFATIVCLILFLGGIQLISIGILGEYISKMFIETKNRPIYFSKEKLGFDDEIL